MFCACTERINFIRVSSNHNLADHLTKALPYNVVLCCHCMTMMLGYQCSDAPNHALAPLVHTDLVFQCGLDDLENYNLQSTIKKM